MFQGIEEDFEDVSLSYIPRSMNGQTDALAREVKIRDYIFFHID